MTRRRIPDEVRSDPWVRPVVAGRKGRGVHLTAADVARLMSDNAIQTNAEAFADDYGCEILHDGTIDWSILWEDDEAKGGAS